MNSDLMQQYIALFQRYERYLFSLTLVVGFVVDNLTLTRIDLWLDNLVLIGYLAIAATGIAVVNVSRGWPGVLAPYPIQYAFGGLFSGFVVFYSRSASWAASWPFLLALGVLLIGNEFFRTRYERLHFQAGIFFVALFSYAVFAVPVVVGKMGAAVFLLSGAISVACMALLLYLLFLASPARVREQQYVLARSVGVIFLVMNTLYFLNIIPPIPLALKEAGVYNRVERVAGDYILEREERPWYAFLLPNTLKVPSGKPAYFYSAVFAPTRLNTEIVHHWQYFDDTTGEWVTALRVNLSIIGGRDGGYRTYSIKRNIAPGEWRVTVETPRGQVIGREKFRIEVPDGGNG